MVKWPYLRLQCRLYTQPTHLIFGTVIDIVRIFYHTKKLVGGSGGVDGVLNEARRISYLPWQNRRARPDEYHRDTKMSPKLYQKRLLIYDFVTYKTYLYDFLISSSAAFFGISSIP